MPNPNLRIIEFKPDNPATPRAELANKFKEINSEWITSMFCLEPKDRKVLGDPENIILAAGGHILFVEMAGKGIIGTCALLKTGEGEFELTKMGVFESSRGLGVGKLLLKAAIEKAKEVCAKRLYLLTNKKCSSAIHLYEQNGFKHNQDIMKEFGAEYARCDVAMIFDRLNDNP